MQTIISRLKFIEWITDILRTNQEVRRRILTAMVTNPDVKSAFVTSYNEEWKLDCATILGGSIIENNVLELMDELLVHWQKEFAAEIAEVKN